MWGNRDIHKTDAMSCQIIKKIWSKMFQLKSEEEKQKKKINIKQQKRNEQPNSNWKETHSSEIVGGQVLFLFHLYIFFFFTFRFCYKLCRLLYCQVINSNNNSDRTAASESLGTKAKSINYREWEFLNSFLWVFIASDPAFFPYWSVGKFVPRLSIINIFHLAYFYSVSLISWLKYNIYIYTCKELSANLNIMYFN